MQKNFKDTTYPLLWIITFLLSGLLIYYIFYAQKSGDETKQIPVSDALAMKVRPITPTVAVLQKNYIGYITPINQVDVISYISGFVEKIDVASGQEIKKNQPLLHIKPDEYIAQNNAAKSAVIKSEATYKNAKNYYDRVINAGDKVISKTDIDNAQAAFLEAQAGLSGAKAQLALSEVNLGYTDIKASIDGVAGYIDLSVGDYVAPGNVLFSIIQYNPIRVVFAMSDKDYFQEHKKEELFAGDTIKLKLSDNDIYEQEGTFAFSDNKIDKATNSIAVYADFANPRKQLMANAYVEVIVEKTLPDAVMLDKQLLYMRDDGNFVFVVRNNLLDLQKVVILGDKNNQYILRNDFKAGDLLLLDNAESIAVGTKINPVFDSHS